MWFAWPARSRDPWPGAPGLRPRRGFNCGEKFAQIAHSSGPPGRGNMWLLLPLCGIFIATSAADSPKDQPYDPFNYDYHSLRIGGLVFAVVLFLMGIIIIFSRHCRCKFNQQQRTGEPDEEEGTLRSSIRRLSTRMR